MRQREKKRNKTTVSCSRANEFLLTLRFNVYLICKNWDIFKSTLPLFQKVLYPFYQWNPEYFHIHIYFCHIIWREEFRLVQKMRTLPFIHPSFMEYLMFHCSVLSPIHTHPSIHSKNYIQFKFSITLFCSLCERPYKFRCHPQK